MRPFLNNRVVRRTQAGHTRTLGALGVLTSLFFAASANAQALKAKKLQVDLVTAYNQCTAPSLIHRASMAFPSCVPTLSTANNPANQYTFGPKGKMSAQIQRAKGDVKLIIKGDDILKGGTPYSGTDLQASFMLRWTDNGCTTDFITYDTDCTLVDFPFPVPLSCTNGKCKSLTPTANAAFPGTFYEGDAANLEIQQIIVWDEDGDNVFKMGLLVP